MKLRTMLLESQTMADRPATAGSSASDQQPEYEDEDEDSRGSEWRYSQRNKSVYDSTLADDYTDPDELYYAGSRTLVYSENGELALENYPTNHTEIATDPQQRRRLLRGTELQPELQGGPWRDDYQWYHLVERVALYGRINRDRSLISFWNTDPGQVQRLLEPCIRQLLRLGEINRDTLVMAPPLQESLPAEQVARASTGRLSQDQLARTQLYRQLHLARGQQKRDLMRQLGLGTATPGDHPVARQLRRAGLLRPGQRWWSPTSETLYSRLTSALGG